MRLFKLKMHDYIDTPKLSVRGLNVINPFFYSSTLHIQFSNTKYTKIKNKKVSDLAIEMIL